MTDTSSTDPGNWEKSAPEDRETEGPLDETEANPVRPYIDLGGVKILPREGLNLRLEVEEQTKRIVAVGLDYADSTLQVQPFAAPRSSGLWDETREQITEQIHQQGGRDAGARRRLRARAARRDPRRSAAGSARRDPGRPLRRRRRAALVPPRRDRRRRRGQAGGRRPGRRPLPQHRRGARLLADAAARPHPAPDAHRARHGPGHLHVAVGAGMTDRSPEEPGGSDHPVGRNADASDAVPSAIGESLARAAQKSGLGKLADGETPTGAALLGRARRRPRPRRDDPAGARLPHPLHVHRERAALDRLLGRWSRSSSPSSASSARRRSRRPSPVCSVSGSRRSSR